MTIPIRNIFISYRHNDNSQFAERIRDWLVNKYGRDQVFMDFDSIPPFVDFEKYISQKVRNCDVLIVIIGPLWSNFFKEKLAKAEKDYVKIELEIAIQEGKFIAPICIEGASMPSMGDVPAELHPILKLNAAFLSSGIHFPDDMNRIINAVENNFSSGSTQAVSSNDRLDIIPADAEKIVVNINIQMVFHHNVPSYTEAQAFTLIYQAAEKWQKQDFDGAIIDCTEAIRLVPSFAWAYNGRGAAKRAKGDFDGAFSDYNQAIFYDPSLAEAHHNKGIAYHMLKDYDNALVCFSNAIDISHSAESYRRRGTVYFRKADFDKALADYDTAIEMDSDNWMAYTNRAAINYEIRNFESSLADINQAISIASKIIPPPQELEKVYCGHARIMIEQDHPIQALADLAEAMRLNPEFADIYDMKGHIFVQLGDEQRAIGFYNVAIDKDAFEPRYYVNRGWARYISQNILGAIQDYDEAIRLNPSFAEAYNNGVTPILQSREIV